MRRLLPATLALLTAISASPFATLSASAQTKPKTVVPAEPRAEARSIVNQLLKEGRIIRSSEVKRGMRGVARSVFQGTKIEEFPIEVLGVLSKVQGGGDLVLIKVLGGPVVERQSGIIAGMSGSPVYINGKMLGAIAIGWGFPKEPIGGVTPITEMIESTLPDPQRAKPAANTAPAPTPSGNNGKVVHTPAAKPRGAGAVKSLSAGGGTAAATRIAPSSQAFPVAAQPHEAYVPRGPLTVAGQPIARLEVTRDFMAKPVPLRMTERGAVLTMKPCSTLLQLSGWSPAALPRLRKLYEPYGIEPAIGPASRKSGVKASLVPGAAIGVQLVSGDMDQTAVGTVTFRWGNRILAFGHPMFGQGATSLPMTTSFIHEIFPSYQRSFKLSSPIDAVGSLQQDTQYAIGGTVGTTADTIPMTIALRDPERNIARTYRVRVMKDPVLTPMLMQNVAIEAVETALGQTSDKMVRVGMRMQIDGSAPIVRRNYLYSQGVVTEAALTDLAGSLSITQNNDFARGSIRRVDLDVALEPVRKTALIKSVFADRNKVKAGDTVRVSVLMEPTGEPNKTMTRVFSIKVPEDAPTGLLRIVASPATSYWAGQIRIGAPPPDPANLKELVTAWGQVGPSNVLMLQASTPDSFLLIDRKKVPSPSPMWQKLLRAGASSSIGFFTETQAQQVGTDYMLSGLQFISLAVESRKDTDKPAEGTVDDSSRSTTPGDSSATPEPTLAPPAAAPGADDDEGDDEEEDNDEAGQSIRLPARDRLWKLFESRRFLNELGALRRIGLRMQDREPSDRPVAPNVTPQPPIAKPTSATPTATTTPTATPTPSVLPVDDGRGVGRPALRWVQGTTADFLRGTFDRAGVFSDGTVRSSAATNLLATTAESFGWSVTGDGQGNVYLGTGNNARIVKVNAAGESSTFYDGLGVAVTALTSDKDGNVYAGITPGGGVIRIAPGGAPQRILSAPDAFIWALEWAPNGDLLVATGGTRGALYRIPAAEVFTGARPDRQPFVTFEQKHARAIATRGDDIFVGTAAEGVLYRVDGSSGTTTALYQADAGTTSTANQQTEVTAVAAAPDGIYFGTFNTGTVYRWEDSGNVTPVYPSPQTSIYAMRRATDGQIYVATGEKGIVYQLIPAAKTSDIKVSRILEPKQLETLALATTPNGDILAGTGNNAAVYRISTSAPANATTADAPSATPAPMGGTYTSPVFDAKNVVSWGGLRTIGDAAWETRSGNTAEPDASWSAWQAVTINDLGEARVVSPPSRYLQYRANLAAGQSLSRVEIVYRAANSAPTVTFSAPRGGEFWHGKKTLTWAGKDPNEDTLRYRLWLSRDNGKNWETVALPDDSKSTAEIDTAKLGDGIYIAKVEASDAGRNPDEPLTGEATSIAFTVDNTPAVIETATLRKQENGDYRLEATALDATSPLTGAEWRFAPAGVPTPTATPAAITATTPAATPAPAPGKVPVVKDAKPAAATAAASPEKPAATTGTPAANTPATTATATPAPTPNPALVPTAAAVEAEANGWQAVLPADGIFDSRRETLVATISAADVAKTTSRKIEFRVRDAAGNITIVTIDMVTGRVTTPASPTPAATPSATPAPTN